MDTGTERDVRSEQDLEGRGRPREGFVGEHRRSEHLGTDEELAVEYAEARRHRERHLGAELRAAEARVETAVHDPDARRVGERADVTREHDPRRDAHALVARERASASSREVHLDADAQRGRSAVHPRDAEIAGQAEIAGGKRAGGRRERGAGQRAGVAVLVESDREVDPEPHPLPEHQRAADVGEELVVDQARDEVAVLIIERERSMRVVEDETERGANMTA